MSAYYIRKCLEPTVFNCAWCDIEFVASAAIELHVKQVHPFNCYNCVKSLANCTLFCRMLKCVVSLTQILASLFCHVLGSRSPMPQLPRNRLAGLHLRLPEYWMQIFATYKQKVFCLQNLFSPQPTRSAAFQKEFATMAGGNS